MRIKSLGITSAFLSFVIFSLLLSCTSESEKKQHLVKSIANTMCDNISTKLSNGVDQVGTGDETIDALAITIIQSLDVPLEDFCHCFTEIMNKELMSKFSYDELKELRKDKIKQLMVASKILEQRDVQADIENCLQITLNKTGEQYQDYQNTLDDKFKK
jgi:hypothetical protein